MLGPSCEGRQSLWFHDQTGVGPMHVVRCQSSTVPSCPDRVGGLTARTERHRTCMPRIPWSLRWCFSRCFSMSPLSARSRFGIKAASCRRSTRDEEFTPVRLRSEVSHWKMPLGSERIVPCA